MKVTAADIYDVDLHPWKPPIILRHSVLFHTELRCDSPTTVDHELPIIPVKPVQSVSLQGLDRGFVFRVL